MFSLLFYAGDGAAAQHHIALIQHGSLSRGGGTLRPAEFQPEAVFCGVDGGLLFGLMIPGAGGDPQRPGQRRNGDPVHILCVDDAVEQLTLRPDGDGIGLHILAADVHRRTQRKAKPLRCPSV